MGIDYSSNLLIGYAFEAKAVEAPFARTVPEKSHMEDRFDPKTGKKLDPVKVVDDEERDVWEFNGESFEDREELYTALAAAAKCQYVLYGQSEYVAFGPDIELSSENPDCGHVYFAGNLSYDAVVKAKAEVRRIGKKLRKFGLELPEPEVVVCWDVG
jgi:hypothetical protein